MNFRGAETVEFSTPFQHGITEDVSFPIKLRVKKKNPSFPVEKEQSFKRKGNVLPFL